MGRYLVKPCAAHGTLVQVLIDPGRGHGLSLGVDPGRKRLASYFAIHVPIVVQRRWNVPCDPVVVAGAAARKCRASAKVAWNFLPTSDDFLWVARGGLREDVRNHNVVSDGT